MEVPSVKHILSNCLIFSVISTIVIAQTPQRYISQNPCTSKGTCHECIQTPSCAWCSDPKYIENIRCFQPSTAAQPNALCPEEYVIDPDNILSTLQNLELSETHTVAGGGGGTIVGGYEGSYNHSESWSGSGSTAWAAGGSGAGAGSFGGGRRIVQVAPQRLNLKLRARQSYSVYMYYKQAEDYPVDLYYLMDLSRSMKDDKDKLSLLGDKLAETMKRLTSNFRLGFGSFVDKVVMPYVSTIPQKLRRPCEICVAPYGFRHHMTLSNNTHMFSTEVKRANVSGNLDAPEGGFDAIMQSVVCRDHIGWRGQARRLLVFSTDAGFHYAGDGKLGGIVKPNDGNCHMDESGFYRESSYQDYPSIEQINLSVKKNSINVIFAVTKDTIEIYRELSKTIEGSSVGKLEGDSSNIVDLIREQYEQISSTVELKHNASSAVSLKFFTACLNGSGVLVNTNKCGGIKVGDTVKFKIDLEVIKCPKDPKDHFQTIQIYPVGINESLIIDLEMLCECKCEKPQFSRINSPYCSNHGTEKCGICDCNPGAFGRKCECTSEDTAKKITTMNCIHPNRSTNLECSGKGECVCGHCTCETRTNENERIYGDYCECDNFSCERHDGKLCSDHGVCDCGVCQCRDGWIGTNCACKNSTDACKPYGVEGELLCSGHGKCECGVCLCDDTPEGRYSGKFCEKCPTCDDRCLEFKDCVLCQQYKEGPLTSEECATNCTKFVPIPIKEVEADEEKGDIKCYYRLENDCHFSYIYNYDENLNLQVIAQEKLECPDRVAVPAIILGVIAAIVLIGMAVLLLWKLITTVHDRREFARFEKEKMKAKWETGENPIYKQATSTFKNPTYSGKW